MKSRKMAGFFAALAVLPTGPGTAQVVDMESAGPTRPLVSQSVQVEAGSTDLPSCKAIAHALVPKLTPVLLRIEESLGSKISRSGQTFRITLAEPLVFEGHELLPAGIEGLGEVVHAKKAGFAGSGGELILAASYLEFGERRIMLRSLAIAQTGASNVGLAGAIGASPLGPVAFLISGHNTEVAAGTHAQAKLAADTEFPLPAEGAAEQCLKEEEEVE